MGVHSMYSLEGTAVGSGLRGVPPVELGKALPVVAMYRPVKGADGNAKIGQLNSVFFWSATAQDAQGLPLLWPTGKSP